MTLLQKAITFLKSWKTTLSGIVPIIISLLVATGVIDADPQAVNDGVGTVIDTGVSTLENIIALIAASVGVIGLFSKDGDKTSEEVFTKNTLNTKRAKDN